MADEPNPTRPFDALRSTRALAPTALHSPPEGDGKE